MLVLFTAMVGAMTVFVAVGALTGQFSFSERRVATRAVRLQRQGIDEVGRPKGDQKLFREDVLAGNASVSAFLQRYSWFASRAATLERADLPLKASEYALTLVVGFLVVGFLAYTLSGLLLVGAGFGIATVLFIETWMKGRAKRRLARFNKQLPIALQLMSTSLRSGFGIMESVSTVGREMDEPLAGEFTRIIEQARIGGSFESGLDEMVRRVESRDLRIVARALEIHRKVGGDLAAILDSVASTMREREELRGHIVALTAQQRLGGMIVGLLPLWVLAFFSVTNPDFISPLWTETTGRILLGAGLAMEAVAFFVMNRIMSIEV